METSFQIISRFQFQSIVKRWYFAPNCL